MRTDTHGVRRLTPGALAARARASETPLGQVSRKDLQTAAREACQALYLRPTVRLVLGELAACYGEQQLARGLIVWPSNDYLVRKTGLAERTVRKCIRELSQFELIVPVDSANRKRFAIRAKNGEIIDAFGFDLAPVYARRLEFAGMLIEQREKQARQSRLFDEITIARKAAEEALRAIAEHFPHQSIVVHAEHLTTLAALTPRRNSIVCIEPLVDDWRKLRALVENLFHSLHTASKETGDAGAGRRHKEANKGLSSDPCKESGEEERAESLGVSLITEACPTVLTYGEAIYSEADLMRVGRSLRPTIGAHPDAWKEATERLGPLRAAILVVIVLQRLEDDLASGAAKIKNPGGLYRDLVRRCAAGEVNLLTELQALRRRHMG